MTCVKTFNWNHAKNQQLVETRGISFEDILFYIQQGQVLDDLEHPNRSRYPNQRVFVVGVDDVAYLVPYVEDDSEIFLKTIIPSRKATRKYFGGGS